jgi:hypothetical protein
MSERIYTKDETKITHHENPQNQKNTKDFFSIFDILMENGNNKFMDIHNKLILEFQLA